MTRGLTRAQVGVTDQMIATYGELIFRLSNNHQLRRGDPIRRRDFDAIEAHRSELGMSDQQIAERVGLTLNQVTLIRNLEERRRFDRAPFHRLNDLGGGRRFRAERYRDPRTLPAYAEEAQILREAMQYHPELVERYVQAGWWRNETLRSWLDAQCDANPDFIAIRCDGEQTSYGQLRTQVETLAGHLSSLGLQAGDVVSLQLPNTPAFLTAYLAVCHVGAVVSTLYLPHRRADMAKLLAAANSKMLICLTELGDFAPAATGVELQSELPRLSAVINVGADVPEAHSFAELVAPSSPSDQHSAPVGADPFLLLFTSGTTAAPKAVPLSYNNMLSNARLSAPEHQIDAGDRVLCAAPFGHLYGLYSFHLALATGANTVLLPVFSPPELAKTVAADKPTVLFAGPPHMQACLANGLIDAENWSSLKQIVLSGSALAPALGYALQEALPHVQITQLWGMTETQAGMYTRPGDPIDVSANSAGRPSPGTEVRIANELGEELANGDEGELQVRGCLLFPGYVANPEANAAAFTTDHWFRSGDLAVRDANGNVSITGRSKDIINRGGVKYNPREVEDLLDAHADILQSAIVPYADKVLGERACCFVVPRPGTTPTLESLVAYLTDRGLAKYKLPEHLEVRSELPLTPTRKVIKGQLTVD